MMNTAKRVDIIRIIDGDTVEIRTPAGIMRKSQSQRVRLYGIDAPESAQKGGKEATRYLQKIIGRKRHIWLQPVGSDQYKRTVGIIYPNGGRPEESYNIRMIQAGQARAYMTTPPFREAFQQAERQAREGNLGIWGRNKNQAPWEWRQGQRRKQKRKVLWTFITLIAIAALLAVLAVTPLCTANFD